MTQPYDAVDWSDQMPAPSDESVRRTEEVARAQLPRDFLDFCKHYHGGFPDPDEIEVAGFGRTMINQILPLDDDPAEQVRSIATVIQDVDDLPDGLIPFGEEPAGNYFCFDCRTPKIAVVFWWHEQGNILKVCNSFADLVEQLANS